MRIVALIAASAAALALAACQPAEKTEEAAAPEAATTEVEVAAPEAPATDVTVETPAAPAAETPAAETTPAQ